LQDTKEMLIITRFYRDLIVKLPTNARTGGSWALALPAIGALRGLAEQENRQRRSRGSSRADHRRRKQRDRPEFDGETVTTGNRWRAELGWPARVLVWAALQRTSSAGKRRVGFGVTRASSWRDQLQPAGNAAGESALDTNGDTGGARLQRALRRQAGRGVEAAARARGRPKSHPL
jgi:hypothetical protein